MGGRSRSRLEEGRDNTLWDDPVERALAISPRRPGGSRDRRVLLPPAGCWSSTATFLSAAARGRSPCSRRHSLLYIEVGERRRLYKDLEALLDWGTASTSRSWLVHRRRVLVASGEIRRLMPAGRSGLTIVGTVADDLIKALPDRPAAHVENM